MRPLYEINADLDALLDSIDTETGEIDGDALTALTMERQEKLEGMALKLKNLAAEAEMIKAEEKNLADRRKAVERNRDSLKAYLMRSLDGETLKTAKVAISYRTSKSVEIDEDKFFEFADFRYLRQTTEINKEAIKAALAAGEEVPGAALVEKQNMVLK